MLFVGLGNPGGKYSKTRHNVGFMAVDHFASKWDAEWKRSKFNALLSEVRCGGEKVWLLKPQTYMNSSGEAVRAFIDFYRMNLQDVTVIYDDMDMEIGHIRLRYKGSSGGHNGMKSIISHVGTEEFKRIRIGISRPKAGDEVIDYVLSTFKKAEQSLLSDAIVRVQEAMEFMLTGTFDQTMAQFNR